MRRVVRRTCGIACGVAIGAALATGNWPVFILSAWGLVWVGTWEPS